MDKIDKLVAWATAHGASVSEDISFRQIRTSGYGAYTDGSGASRIHIPPEIILRLSHASKHFQIGETEIRKTQNVNGFLKLFLAHERANPSSFFAPYICTLPSSAQINSPYVWSKAEKELLRGTNLGGSLRENLQQIVEEWWSVLAALPEGTELPANHHFNLKFYYESKFYDDDMLYSYLRADAAENWASFPAYLWASMVVKSRAFPCALLSAAQHVDALQEDVVMLLPVVDLLNHDPTADVTWDGKDGFTFSRNGAGSEGELFNNYGRKGNEELLLAYGFCLPSNSADTVALKIKIPEQILPFISQKVALPQLTDYTSSVVSGSSKTSGAFDDGVLFFLSKDHVPEPLVQVFQWLVQNPMEGQSRASLRMQLSGLNHLRQALESKLSLVQKNVPETEHTAQITTYLSGQRKVLQSAVSWVKHTESDVLTAHKAQVLTLKAVYKKDVPFANSLLVTMGLGSYADIVAHDQMDQVWLLYLIRCANSQEYAEGFFPDWVGECFRRMDAVTEMDAAEVVRFQGLYENLILPMHAAVPEIYGRGKWTVRELIVSTRVMDTFGFVRGKNQECILVEPEEE